MSGKVTSGGPLVGNNESDVHISRENQNKINTFAIRNAWLDELNQELKQKENDIKNLEDAEADILMFDDDSIPVPILVGDCYINYNQEEATSIVGKLVDKAKTDVKNIQAKIDSIKKEMAGLKHELYDQFGENINLEHEDE